MFIDAHTHVFHPKIAQKVLNQLETHYSITPVGSGLIEDLLNRLQTAGLDKAVVLTAATAPAQVIPANNWAIQIKKDHERLVPFGTIHPDFADMEEELNRLERNGIRGLKIHPDFQSFWLDAPEFYEIMEMIEDRFVCLFHIGDRLPPEQNPSCPKKLAALRKAFPKPTLIAAHMGGYLHWNEALEHLVDSDIYVDTSSVTSFVDNDLLTKLFRSHSKDRILFGSDYPLFDANNEINQLQQRLKLSDKDLETILSNAATMLSE